VRHPAGRAIDRHADQTANGRNLLQAMFDGGGGAGSLSPRDAPAIAHDRSEAVRIAVKYRTPGPDYPTATCQNGSDAMAHPRLAGLPDSAQISRLVSQRIVQDEDGKPADFTAFQRDPADSRPAVAD